MNVIKRIGVLGGVGCAGYTIGVLIERNKHDNNTKYPGMPIFGSVSAATAFSPTTQPATPPVLTSDVKNNRIGQVSVD